MLQINECPRKYVGADVTEAVNVASLCSIGVLPSAGGLMDQSAWFVNLWQQLQSEQSAIEAEQAERIRSV